LSRRAKSSERVERALKALSDPQRVAILRLVRGQELAAGEIATHFSTSRQAVSQSLRLLTSSGLLELRREGTRRLYRVRPEVFGELREFLDDFWGARLAALKARAERDHRGRRGRG
jgi:DNA-binding transcriptional ArsR family regulator